MPFLILHLSDIHLTAVRDENPILTRPEHIAAAASSVHPQPTAVFIAFSGDAAFSGKKSEFSSFEDFVHRLLTEIKERFPNSPTYLMIVPGNHDCDFDSHDSLREMVLSQIGSRPLDEPLLEAALRVQTEFWALPPSIGSDNSPTDSLSRAYTRLSVTTALGAVEFSLLNTALFSRLSERQGSLVFPADLIPTSVGTATETALVVSVMHHPLNWFESSNARELRRALETTSDIILTGHEHETGMFMVSLAQQGQIEYVEGGVLQDAEDPSRSCFNILLADPGKQELESHTFQWVDSELYEHVTPPTTIPYLRNSLRTRNQFTLSQAFEEELVDPGANYTHRAKDAITLDDIFVYPDIRHFPDGGHGDPKIVREDLASFVLDAGHTIVFGPDKSGKTALSKTLFRDFRNRGLVPVLFSGLDFKRAVEHTTQATIAERFSKQYSAPTHERFAQLPRDKRVAIIDDFHSMPLNTRGRDRVLGELEAFFDCVVLLADDPARFDDLVERDEDFRLWRYATCEILQLGHVKRSDLIKRWFFLGRSLSHDERELLREAQQAERLISDLIGRALIPAYPLFILVLLQQLEANKRVDVTSTSGSFGYLYEALLTAALARASQLRLDLETQYTYLSEFANATFSRKVDRLPLAAVRAWHDRYCEDYARRLDLDALLASFATAGILTSREGYVGFKYPYLYYYFLGRYFRDHLDTQAVRDAIKRMAHQLHHEESANVLVILSYLSKDPLIIDTVLDAASALFSSQPEFDLVEGTSFLAKFAADIPALVLSAGDSETRRRKMLADADAKELSVADDPSSANASTQETEERDVESLLQVNVAFKTMQILGQILRNYHGSLTAHAKHAIAKALHSLGFRLMGFFFTAIEAGREDIVQYLYDVIHEKYPGWSEERIKARIGNLVFNLAEGIGFVLTKHIADSCGEEALEVTYAQLLQSSPTSSYRIVDMAIHMFHFRGFPQDELLALFGLYNDKPFPAELLRHLAWYYFYIYPARFDVLQRVCARMGIRIHPALIQDQRPKLLPGG